MWVAEDEFVTQLVAHVSHVEGTFLAAYLGIEYHVKQYVPQFLADIRVIVPDEGIAQFKSFLDGVRAQALVGLLSVPGALFA